MTAGVEIRNDSGYLQITEAYTNFVLVGKGSVALDGGAWSHSSVGGAWTAGSHCQISVPNTSGFPPLMALRCSTEVILLAANLVSGNWVFDVTSVYGTAHTETVYWYAFNPCPNVAPSNYGFEVFKADGTLAFHSGYPPLRVADVRTTAGTTTLATGRVCALAVAQHTITVSSELPVGPNWSRVWTGDNLKTSGNTGTVGSFQYCFSTNSVHFGTSGVTSGSTVVLVVDVTDY
jgi:hypothetical protein